MFWKEGFPALIGHGLQVTEWEHYAKGVILGKGPSSWWSNLRVKWLREAAPGGSRGPGAPSDLLFPRREGLRTEENPSVSDFP
jgi:hypothetical protein